MLTSPLLILLLSLSTPTHAASDKTYPSELGPLTVATLAQNLEQPWALAFLPDNQGLMITERPGRLRPPGAAYAMGGNAWRILSRVIG